MSLQLIENRAASGLLERRASRDAFLPARAVWERYSVTAMTLHRWLRR
jgi:hypothetical protein